MPPEHDRETQSIDLVYLYKAREKGGLEQQQQHATNSSMIEATQLLLRLRCHCVVVVVMHRTL